MSQQVHTSAAEIPGLGMPKYAEPRRIFFRMDRIQRLAALAGYHGEVTITGHAGDSTQQSIAIGGTLTEGYDVASASASLAGVRQASLGKVQYQAGDPNCHHRGALTLSLNTTRIREVVQGRERQPKAWAGALHAATGGLLFKAACEHFVKDNFVRGKLPTKEVVYNLLLHAVIQLVSTPFVAESSLRENLALRAAAYGTSLALFNIATAENLRKNGYPVRESCFSILPAFHIERVGAVWVGSRICKLAKVARP